jgi:hypothetical protein
MIGALFIVVLWCAAIALTGFWLHQHGFLRWIDFHFISQRSKST